MRVYRVPKAMSGAVRRCGVRHRTGTAMLAGALAVLPTMLVTGSSAQWVNLAAGDEPGHPVAGLAGGLPSEAPTVSVNGSLPDSPTPAALPAYLPQSVTGPLGIPDTALAAYRRAADIMAREAPGCHLDWALIASIGRIESNHARGGYVDANGTTLEPILGPVLNGVGPVAAIRDTDGGRHDRDPVWDRAVGPTQFIPSTWARYASDGNGDGVTDPNNIFDAALATGRYLCSGGLDLADDAQLRAALFRYNNSQSYVDTVIAWARAYRSGVAAVPNSRVPIGVPVNTTTVSGAPAPVPPPGLPGESTPAPGGQPSTRPGSPSNELPAENGTNPSKPGPSDPTTPSDPPSTPSDPPSTPSDPPSTPSDPPSTPSDPPPSGDDPSTEPGEDTCETPTPGEEAATGSESESESGSESPAPCDPETGEPTSGTNRSDTPSGVEPSSGSSTP
ncbi:Transglycosylase SLT domain-containing protein [Amycolatopsis arida]|uniref:Transglycosylase SLT domain-containing protein n=1 Tax=Amycolatopsis arida TaxID=587909 RepID=A0A1I5PYQ6_9PSEU|nr:lytic murein transglycosylase [Amycolatopsis arida]TDX98657.1 transglycosylase protein with SLT domain [Amycolatopsis arida]SFP39213.1 Transglycosylase SLT domain-containing protein [Amycolatopsis arida]